MSEENLPQTLPDWQHRGDYIRTRSARKGSAGETDIETAWADEAYADPAAVIFRPDPGVQKRGVRSHDRMVGQRGLPHHRHHGPRRCHAVGRERVEVERDRPALVRTSRKTPATRRSTP
ncbi:hypothetical protein GCM10010102_18740 [Promicromonospora citrea]|uniref:Uncharacterized protein n=1 Tax=Promicromonospora citrea TaxID=43677 RepID=A0A8H9L507_9MICO|nr:hypothetical protein GCM10010102_18740 [Promicromonospora citrea]